MHVSLSVCLIDYWRKNIVVSYMSVSLCLPRSLSLPRKNFDTYAHVISLYFPSPSLLRLFYITLLTPPFWHFP